MTTADRVIAAGRADLGCAESPPGSNSGACVHRIQSSTGAFGQAWCVSAVMRWWQEGGVDTSRILTAGTAALVDGARSLGWLRSRPVPGCAVVWRPGPLGHTEVFIQPEGGPLARTIGGNTGDAVREHFRDTAGAFFVVPPELEVVSAPVFTTVYWWEDPAAKPVLHHLRNTIAAREADISKWVAAGGQPGHVRRGQVSVHRHGKLVPVFAWWTGPRKRSPDFPTRAKRDADLKKVAASSGHSLRPRSRRVRVS